MTFTIGLPELIIGGLLILVMARTFYIMYIRRERGGDITGAFFGAFATFLEVCVWLAVSLILLAIYGGIRFW
jgi:hypothetical protein